MGREGSVCRRISRVGVAKIPRKVPSQDWNRNEKSGVISWVFSLCQISTSWMWHVSYRIPPKIQEACGVKLARIPGLRNLIQAQKSLLTERGGLPGVWKGSLWGKRESRSIQPRVSVSCLIEGNKEVHLLGWTWSSALYMLTVSLGLFKDPIKGILLSSLVVEKSDARRG